jgi:hypothetical protein
LKSATCVYYQGIGTPQLAAIHCKHFPADRSNQADFINVSILKRSQLAGSLQAQNLLLVIKGIWT